MSSTSSKNSRNRRSSILKVRQTTVETAIDVTEQPKNLRRVSFHHQKTVKEYDKEKHELSATSPLKETLKEAMSDFDSTKSNSTFMSLGTPDRTTGRENNTMTLFRGMISSGQPSSIHLDTKDMSFSIMEDPAQSDARNDTMDIFNGLNRGHMSVHSKTVDISYRMEESMNENLENLADKTMDVFGNGVNQSTRTLSNMTMDMDISKADHTLSDGEDTMGVFGGASAKVDTTIPLDNTMDVFGVASAKVDTTIPHDNTMDVFTADSESCDKSRLSQSILMDMTANPSPASSQDRTIAVFGQSSQCDESVAMEEETMVEEEKKEDTPSPTQPSSSTLSNTLNEKQSPSLDDTLGIFGNKTFEGDKSVAMDEASMIEEEKEVEKMEPPSSKSPLQPTSSTQAKTLNETQSPSLDDTMAIFGNIPLEAGDDDNPMDVSVAAVQPISTLDRADSPTMNMFKRKGDDEMDESGTMDVSGSKKWKEDGDSSVTENGEMKEAHEVEERSHKKSEEMDEEDATMNVFGVKIDVTMDERVMIEEDEKGNPAIMEARGSGDDERTMNVFGMGESCQMDVTGTTLNGVQKGGEYSRMDLTGDGTLGVFGKKEEEEMDEEDKRIGVKEDEEKEKTIHESPSTNGSRGEEKSIGDKNGSEDMEEVTPIPSQSPRYDEERRKTRLSTVIEVSSHYSAASSQSMIQRVESAGDETKEDGILDGMEDGPGGKEESKPIEITDGEGSVRMEGMEDESMNSPSPTESNTTLSTTFTKRNMLDETRLSDRSIMNITRTFDEIVLERIDWMIRENEEGEEMGEMVKENEIPFIEETKKAIERSEAVVEGLLSEINQLENSDLLSKSISKLNSIKVPEYRLLFEWARREAQREWWEKRREKAEKMNGEVDKRRKKDDEELNTFKDDFHMMARLNELKEDVESMAKEVEMGRGLSRNTIDELIRASKKKEEEKERLEREVNRMELESIKESTIALKIMAERCNAVDESIKRKMEERERTKREMRAYLGQLTNNLK